MNAYHHALCLVAELKKLTRKDFTPLVEERKLRLDREVPYEVVTRTLRGTLQSYVSVRVSEILIPDKQLYGVDVDAALVRELSHGRRGGLSKGVASYLDLMVAAM